MEPRRFFGGFSVEETAEVLQVSPQTVMRELGGDDSGQACHVSHFAAVRLRDGRSFDLVVHLTDPDKS